MNEYTPRKNGIIDIHIIWDCTEETTRSCFLPGIVIVCVVPCRSRRTGGTAVVGEELILPLSALGARLPLTRISQFPPPWTNLIHAPPVNLHNARRWGEKLNELLHGQPSLILCRKKTTGVLATSHCIPYALIRGYLVAQILYSLIYVHLITTTSMIHWLNVQIPV